MSRKPEKLLVLCCEAEDHYDIKQSKITIYLFDFCYLTCYSGASQS